ncbi:unnamed protein product [Coregonus sp. 'balchen']|nr:unnamed protein product [Coregonus sp. 'balchen']
MSQGLLYTEQIPLVLLALQEIAGSSSWHARYTVLTYLQIMVFYNLFTFMSDQGAVNDVRTLVICLLEDEQLEGSVITVAFADSTMEGPCVREMAATTLSGFLQCNFLSIDGPMQSHFEALCKTRLPKKRKRELGSVVDTIPSGDLVRRHAGVLGLSACILSSPYDVPTWMPQLLMNLSAHLNDTQPIEVRRTNPHSSTTCSLSLSLSLLNLSRSLSFLNLSLSFLNLSLSLSFLNLSLVPESLSLSPESLSLSPESLYLSPPADDSEEDPV